MSDVRFTVDIAQDALEQAAFLAKVDPEGVAMVLARIDLLATDPRPVGAFPYGADAVRLHVGFNRVMAVIRDDAAQVTVIHIGRAS
jgi:mRNA interferase RelE/StbE